MVGKPCPAVSHLKLRVKLILLTVGVASCQMVVRVGQKYLQLSEGHLPDSAVPNPVGDAIVTSSLSLNHC